MTFEDVDGVEATLCATFAGEHGTAEAVVVVEGGGAQRVGGADPLGGGAGDDGVRTCCEGDLGLAWFDALFGPLALLVSAAVTLKKKKDNGLIK